MTQVRKCKGDQRGLGLTVIQRILMKSFRSIPTCDFFNYFLCKWCTKSYDIRRVTAYQYLHTSAKNFILYEKTLEKPGMSGLPERVTVMLWKDGMMEFQPADFTQSIVNFIDPSSANGVTEVTVALNENRLHISTPRKGATNVKIKRPPFCPIHHMTETDKQSLPPEISTRGIDCGAAIILESGDGQVLLTRRGNHLRTFPGIWVPPGGHIEKDETLLEAGLRELKEETGLIVTPDMCCDNNLDIMAMWESVFPPRLSLGQPKRHHAVIYLHAKLKQHITAQSLNDRINIDPVEVGAAAWFDRSQIEAITSVKEGEGQTEPRCDIQKLSAATFRAILLNENEEQVHMNLPLADLLKVSGDDKDHRGRVSTGTKFALEEWLSLSQR